MQLLSGISKGGPLKYRPFWVISPELHPIKKSQQLRQKIWAPIPWSWILFTHRPTKVSGAYDIDMGFFYVVEVEHPDFLSAFQKYRNQTLRQLVLLVNNLGDVGRLYIYITLPKRKKGKETTWNEKKWEDVSRILYLVHAFGWNLLPKRSRLFKLIRCLSECYLVRQSLGRLVFQHHGGSKVWFETSKLTSYFFWKQLQHLCEKIVYKSVTKELLSIESWFSKRDHYNSFMK